MPVSCASTHHALASLRNRLCLTYAPRGDVNVSRVKFFFLYGLDCRCQCHVFFASEVPSLWTSVSHRSQGLSKTPFYPRFFLSLPLRFFLCAQGCGDRVLRRTAWWWVLAFPPDSCRSLMVTQSCSSVVPPLLWSPPDCPCSLGVVSCVPLAAFQHLFACCGI